MNEISLAAFEPDESMKLKNKAMKDINGLKKKKKHIKQKFSWLFSNWLAYQNTDTVQRIVEIKKKDHILCYHLNDQWDNITISRNVHSPAYKMRFSISTSQVTKPSPIYRVIVSGKDLRLSSFLSSSKN